MVHVPFWDGDPSHPFPSVTLRIDFRGNDVGDFVFHCHILDHEDGGMMNIIRVQNPSTPVAALGTGHDERAAAKPHAASTEHATMTMEVGNHMVHPQKQSKGSMPTPDPRNSK